MIVDQEPHQLLGQGEQLPGDNVHGGAAAQSGVDVLDGGVKVEGSLVGENLVFVKFEGLAPPLGEIDDGAVADQHALGYAGGAGGEDGVNRIRIDGAMLPSLDFLGAQGFGGQKILYVEYRAFPLDFLGQLVTPAGDQAFGTQSVDDQLHPLIGHLNVDGHIEAAGVGNAQEGLDDLYALVHVHQHRGADGNRIQQTAGDSQSVRLQLRKGDLSGFIGVGDFASELLFCDFQIIRDIFDHSDGTSLFPG